MQALPHDLRLFKVATPGSLRYGVFCGQLPIRKGTRFGPYTGSVVRLEERGSVQNEYMWEVRDLKVISFSLELFYFLPYAFRCETKETAEPLLNSQSEETNT